MKPADKEEKKGIPIKTGRWLTFILIVLLAFAALRDLVPPRPLSDSAPPTEFSAGRALVPLHFIAARPHPSGSAENARVRDYLLQQLRSMGLAPQIQRASAVASYDTWGPPYWAGSAENVMVRLDGTNSTGTLVWMAHYDSVPTGPGATDNGSGVVVLFETLRALQAGPGLRNTSVFLFTDGEEAGSIGAEAFAREHPWAKKVTLAINIDSGGSCGPAVIGVEGPHSGRIVRELAKAIPHPLAASLGEELRRLSPHTAGDDRPFLQKGIPVVGADYVGCNTSYHVMQDNVQNLDARSLQDLGNYALAVARHFGSIDLQHSADVGDAVYFTFVRHLFIYPVAWVRLLMVVLLLLLGLILWLGFARRQLSVKGLLLALLLWMASAVAAGSLAGLLWSALDRSQLVNSSFFSAYNAGTYASGIMSLAVALVLSLYVLLRQKVARADLTAGACLWCAVLMVLTSLFAPGASFLFTWPLIFSLLALLFIFGFHGADSWLSRLLALLGAALVVDIFALMLGYVIITLGEELSQSMIVVGVVAAVMLALLAPQLDVMTARQKWLLPGAALCLGVVLIAAGILHHGYDAQHPKPDGISYWLDADTGKSSWTSFDSTPDAWTSQFLTGAIEHGKLSNFGWLNELPFLRTSAPSLSLPSPELKVTSDSTAGGERMLRVQIRSPRQARSLWVMVQQAAVLRATIAANPAPVTEADTRGKLWGFLYTSLPLEGIDLNLTMKAGDTAEISVIDQSDGLPDIPGFSVRRRPPDLMPQFWPTFDETASVKRTFKLAAR